MHVVEEHLAYDTTCDTNLFGKHLAYDITCEVHVFTKHRLIHIFWVAILSSEKIKTYFKEPFPPHAWHNSWKYPNHRINNLVMQNFSLKVNRLMEKKHPVVVFK